MSCGRVEVKVTVRFLELTVILWLAQMTLVPDNDMFQYLGIQVHEYDVHNLLSKVWGEMCLCVHERKCKWSKR